jgi:hypothetical protein
MATSSGPPRPRHAKSPFKAQPEPVIEEFEVSDRVSHDAYGLGRVVGVDAAGVTVDFGNGNVRVTSPFRKMTKL